VALQSGHYSYRVDLKGRTQVNTQTNTKRTIRRVCAEKDLLHPAVAKHDFSALETRFIREEEGLAAAGGLVIDEYKKFLTLKLRCEEHKGPIRLAPSPTVDACWQCHLLDPSDCAELYDAANAVISRDPDADDRDPETTQRRTQATICAYRCRFSCDMPVDVWDFDDDIKKLEEEERPIKRQR